MTDLVKSAARTLEVLEYFSQVRRPAALAEIVVALDIPQSSASMLMRSLVKLGYLEFLSESRKFRPTLRVSLLGDWIAPALASGPLTEKLSDLQRASGETALLARQQGADLQYVFSIQPNESVQLTMRPGLRRPMARTALGRALLSALPDATALKIIRRNNSDAKRPEHRVDETRCLEQLEAVRASGISESDNNGATPDAHVVGALLPVSSDSERLAVGVGGPAVRMFRRRLEIVGALEQWLGRSGTARP